jgi:hypothetical protein
VSLTYIYSGFSKIAIPGTVGAAIVYLPTGPFPAGSTFNVFGQILDPYGNGIPAANLTSLTLTIFDSLTGAIINGVSNVNILNVDRGTVDTQGNLVVMLNPGDTSTAEAPGATFVARSLLVSWAGTYSTTPPSSSPSSIGGFVIGQSPIGGGGSAPTTPGSDIGGFVIGQSPIESVIGSRSLMALTAAPDPPAAIGDSSIGGFAIGQSPIGGGTTPTPTTMAVVSSQQINFGLVTMGGGSSGGFVIGVGGIGTSPIG